MHVRRAGGHDHPVELLLLDGLLDGGLPGLGARVHDVLGVDDVLEGERPLGDILDVDGGGDVAAAMADEDPDPHDFASASAVSGSPAAPGRAAAAAGAGSAAALASRAAALAAFSAAFRSSSALTLAAAAMALRTKRLGVDHVLAQHHILGAEAQGQAHHLRQIEDWHLIVGAS